MTTQAQVHASTTDALNLLRMGYTLPSIAKRLHVGYSALHKRIRAEYPHIHPRKLSMTAKAIKYRTLFGLGISQHQIAEVERYTQAAVSYIIRMGYHEDHAKEARPTIVGVVGQGVNEMDGRTVTPGAYTIVPLIDGQYILKNGRAQYRVSHEQLSGRVSLPTQES